MKSKITLITLALAGAACAAWTPKDSAVDYPTMTVPAAGDAIPIWDAGTDATQQIFWSTFTGAFQGLDTDLTTIAGLSDPNADRVLFWDDSAGAYAYLTVGTGLDITGTTLTATGSGTGDVTAAANYGTDNVLIRSDGTGKGTQATGITVSDADAISGVASIATTGAVSAGSLEFEGATGDAFETAFAVVDPTADNTLTLPNASGTVVSTGQLTDAFIIAISDETTALTSGTAKVTFRAPYAFTITGVKGSLTTVSSSGTPTWDINEAGTTILSTKLTIDASEKTSTTAATAAVVSDASIAADAEITIDIDTAGTSAAGGKVTIIHTH